MIRTKAQTTVEELGSRYFLIGPYNEHQVRTEVEVEEPTDVSFREALNALRNHGIKVCVIKSLF